MCVVVIYSGGGRGSLRRVMKGNVCVGHGWVTWCVGGSEWVDGEYTVYIVSTCCIGWNGERLGVTGSV